MYCTIANEVTPVVLVSRWLSLSKRTVNVVVYSVEMSLQHCDTSDEDVPSSLSSGL